MENEKQNQDNRGVSETGDRQQSTQPQKMSAGGGSQDTQRRHLPRGEDNHQAAKTPEEQDRKEGSRTEATQRHRTRTTRGRAPLGHGGKTKLWSRWRKLPTYRGEKAGTHYQRKRKNPEDSEANRKGEPRGDHKSKRRRAPRAAPPSMDRRREEEENGVDHNQEKTDEQKGEGGPPPKGTEDPLY